METFNKFTGIGYVSIASHHPYITNKIIYNYYRFGDEIVLVRVLYVLRLFRI